MGKLKLTIDQLKNYLGTGLKIEPLIKHTSSGNLILDEFGVNILYEYFIEDVVPHFYRLADLDKFIPELGFVPLDKLNNYRELSTGKMTKSGWVNDTVGICDRNIQCDLSVIGGGSWEGGIEDVETFQFFTLYQQLFEWHFWVFDQSYFESGLVIDKLKYYEK